jgi:hypothetical protein
MERCLAGCMNPPGKLRVALPSLNRPEFGCVSPPLEPYHSQLVNQPPEHRAEPWLGGLRRCPRLALGISEERPQLGGPAVYQMLLSASGGEGGLNMPKHG